MQALKIKIKGIQCDNLECDYTDKEVLFSDYEKLVNKPCPKCGRNLLTKQDYDTVKLLIDMTRIVNECVPEVAEDEELYKMSANLNGTGKVVFSEIEKSGE